MLCNEDPRIKDVQYGASAPSGDSAYRLQVPTFTDVMRTQRKARVVSLALKDRSAIMLAGHGGDAVTWLSNTMDGWVTSPVYSEAPVPAVKAFLDANPIAADLGKTWAKRLPASAYSGPDDAAGEAPPAGWTRSFPHEVNGTNGVADGSFFAQWRDSPFADAYLGRFAAALAERPAARDTRDDRRARRQLLDARYGRPCLRASQPRGAGSLRESRRDHRRPLRGARRAGRQGAVGGRRSAPITA